MFNLDRLMRLGSATGYEGQHQGRRCEIEARGCFGFPHDFAVPCGRVMHSRPQTL